VPFDRSFLRLIQKISIVTLKIQPVESKSAFDGMAFQSRLEIVTSDCRLAAGHISTKEEKKNHYWLANVQVNQISAF
jgi:hypothetical protein